LFGVTFGMAEERPNQSLELSDKIDRYIGGDPDRGYPGGFDGTNIEGGPLEKLKINELSTALNTYNTSKIPDTKKELFVCLFELMQTSPKFFSSVLRDSTGVTRNLNLRLMEIFCVDSKWYTDNMNSSEYDQKRGHDNEVKRLRYCSIKQQIPSVLFLEFLLFVCIEIDQLTQRFIATIQEENYVDAVHRDLENNFNRSILCIINLIGRASRISDNDSVINIAFALHDLQIITSESSQQVEAIKMQILVIYGRRTRFGGTVTPNSLSLSSTIGTLCDEIIKVFIPEDATGLTQSQSPGRSSEIKVRDVESARVLDSVKGSQRFILSDKDKIDIAKSFGWCSFLFNKPDGCKRHAGAMDGPKLHHEKWLHPPNHKSGTFYVFDVCNEQPVIRRINSAQGFRTGKPYGGRKSLKKYRKNSKRSSTPRPHLSTKRRTRRRHRH
jgi:hypothetical protein